MGFVLLVAALTLVMIPLIIILAPMMTKIIEMKMMSFIVKNLKSLNADVALTKPFRLAHSIVGQGDVLSLTAKPKLLDQYSLVKVCLFIDNEKIWNRLCLLLLPALGITPLSDILPLSLPSTTLTTTPSAMSKFVPLKTIVLAIIGALDNKISNNNLGMKITTNKVNCILISPYLCPLHQWIGIKWNSICALPHISCQYFMNWASLYLHYRFSAQVIWRYPRWWNSFDLKTTTKTETKTKKNRSMLGGRPATRNHQRGYPP